MYGEGISKEGDLLDIAALHNIVEKSGAWYSYKGERIGQGRENARTFLKENKDTLIKLDAEVRKQLGLTAPAAPTAVPAPAQSAPQTGRVTTMPSAPPEASKGAGCAAVDRLRSRFCACHPEQSEGSGFLPTVASLMTRAKPRSLASLGMTTCL